MAEQENKVGSATKIVSYDNNTNKSPSVNFINYFFKITKLI